MKFPNDSLFYWTAGCTSIFFLWELSLYLFNGTFIFVNISSAVSITSLLSIIGLFISYKIVVKEPKPQLLVTMAIICSFIAISVLMDVMTYFQGVSYCKAVKIVPAWCAQTLNHFSVTSIILPICCGAIAGLHIFTSAAFYRAFMEERSTRFEPKTLSVIVGKPV